MSRKTVNFRRSAIENLPEAKPVLYRIQTEGGKTNYVGVAKKGRVQERIKEHLDSGEIPGVKVQIHQMPSIQDAVNAEARVIARTKPKYHEQGK